MAEIREARLHSPLGEDKIFVRAMSGHDALGQRLEVHDVLDAEVAQVGEASKRLQQFRIHHPA